MRCFIPPSPLYHGFASVCAALLLSACATSTTRAPSVPVSAVPPPPSVTVPAAQGWSDNYDSALGALGVQLSGNAPLESSAPLLNSGVSFAGLDQRLQYSAGYQLKPGDLLDPSASARWRANALPQTVSNQTVNQQLKLKLDTMAGAPILLGAQYQQQAALRVDGSTESAQQAMDLNWAPAFAAVHLNWTPEGAPIDTTQALQCERMGQLSVPLASMLGDTRGSRFLAVDARARACRVSGDDPQLAMLSANTWSTGVRWGRPSLQTALRVQGVTPGVDSGVIASDRPLTAGSGYELRLSQQRALGDWQASAGVAYRRPPDAERSAESIVSSPWASNAELSRRLAAATVAASWQRGDAYWFLPEVRDQADTFALSVNFAPWSTDWFGTYTPTMAMSYSWIKADRSSTRDDDQTVNWNLAFPWR